MKRPESTTNAQLIVMSSFQYCSFLFFPQVDFLWVPIFTVSFAEPALAVTLRSGTSGMRFNLRGHHNKNQRFIGHLVPQSCLLLNCGSDITSQTCWRQPGLQTLIGTCQRACDEPRVFAPMILPGNKSEGAWWKMPRSTEGPQSITRSTQISNCKSRSPPYPGVMTWWDGIFEFPV